jgi:hypothetical protein
MNLKLVLIATLLVTMLIATTVPISLATNCWSGGNYRGWVDGQDMTGPIGATKRCEAKLHTCFAGGAGDPAIPCTVADFRGCQAVCSAVESNVACDPTVCLNRCLAARVPGYADTCD